MEGERQRRFWLVNLLLPDTQATQSEESAAAGNGPPLKTAAAAPTPGARLLVELLSLKLLAGAVSAASSSAAVAPEQAVSVGERIHPSAEWRKRLLAVRSCLEQLVSPLMPSPSSAASPALSASERLLVRLLRKEPRLWLSVMPEVSSLLLLMTTAEEATAASVAKEEVDR